MKRYPKGTWMRLVSREMLKARMKDRQMSYADLALRVGCSAGFVSHLTAGRKQSCSQELAHLIAGVLDLPVEFLFVPGESTDGRSFPKFKATKAGKKAAA